MVVRRIMGGVNWASGGFSYNKEPQMNFKVTLMAAALTLASGAAFAQQGTVQRDVNQQQRIEQGLQSGALNTREAARLEKQESAVQRDQARALKDGTLTPQEKARLTAEQNRVSRNIANE